MAGLPPEVLSLIFEHLDEFSLDNVALVCRSWHLCAGEPEWKQLFLQRFGTVNAPNLTSAPTWRREYKARSQILAKWKRGSRNSTANISYNVNIGQFSHMFVDFRAFKVLCFSIWRGSGRISDPRLGKIPKRPIYSSRHNQVSSSTSCVDGCKFGLAYGYDTGNVAVAIFTKSSLAYKHHEMPWKHERSVSCIWLTKSQVFNEKQSGVCVVSASKDGSITLLLGSPDRSLKSRSVLHHQLSSTAIVNLTVTFDIVVAIDAAGVMYLVKNDSFVILSSLPPLPDTQLYDIKKFAVVGNKFVVVQLDSRIYRVELPESVDFPVEKTDSPVNLAVQCEELVIPSHLITPNFSSTRICAFAVDGANGPGAHHIGAAFANGMVCAWQVPGDLNPLWSQFTPLLDGNDATFGPPVTQLAINPVVMVQSGYNGKSTAVDILTGSPLRLVSDKIPREVVDGRLRGFEGDRIACTHLEIDSDPFSTQGMIGINSVVQYFNLEPGSAKAAKQLQQSYMRSLNQGRQQSYASTPSNTRHELSQQIAEAVEAHHEQLQADQERAEVEEFLQEEYGMGDLEDEELLAYALSVSQQEHETENLDDDEDLRRAIELSQTEMAAEQPQEDLEDQENQDYLLALRLSQETS